jgi:hypothetical protein
MLMATSGLDAEIIRMQRNCLRRNLQFCIARAADFSGVRLTRPVEDIYWSWRWACCVRSRLRCPERPTARTPIMAPNGMKVKNTSMPL